MKLPDSIHHPCAWHGTQLFDRPDWLWTLERPEIDELIQTLPQLEAHSCENIGAESLADTKLAGKLAAVQDSLENGSGACLIKGLPMADLTVEQTRRLFWAMAQRIGTPVSQSASGERIFDVRDEGHPPGDQRIRGPNTRKRLSFHTDRCDVIAFLCVRQAKSGGENDIISSAALFNRILETEPETARRLMEPYFYQRHNVDQGNDRPYCSQPIFSVYQGHFASNYLRLLIDRAYASGHIPPMTDQQRSALEKLEECAEDPSLRATFRQEPGDIVLLNNFVTFHRRSEFVDHEQPERKRHLLRIWLSVPNSRPLHPDFSANYGATQAGAIRGGMRAMT